MLNLTPRQADWLFALQRPWPLVERPLAALAEALKTTEGALAGFLETLRGEGLVRRVGGVFDARRLGYRSCLFGACAGEGAALEAAAAEVCAVPGVTHAYVRGWPEGVSLGGTSSQDYEGYPNLWYTLSAQAGRFEAEAARLAHLGAVPFPALARYKIDVVFDARTRGRDERTEYASPAHVCAATLPDAEGQAVVRRYQDDTADPCAPFRPEDLPRLRAWQADGTLRRFALLLYHRASGFTANGMCCWRVPVVEADGFGRRLAAEPDVTHCYARPLTDAFPFNLYAMIHKTSWEEGFDTFRGLTRAAGLPADGKVFFSTREFKKSSIRFFVEE